MEGRNSSWSGCRAHLQHVEEQHHHDRVVQKELQALEGELVEVVVHCLHARGCLRIVLEVLQKQLGVGQSAEADCHFFGVQAQHVDLLTELVDNVLEVAADQLVTVVGCKAVAPGRSHMRIELPLAADEFLVDYLVAELGHHYWIEAEL